MKPTYKTLALVLIQTIFLFAGSSSVYALEQLVNRSFQANINPATDWSQATKIAQPETMDEWGRINTDSYDAAPLYGCYHAKHIPPGGSDNLFYHADGAIWQNFPTAAIASDTYASISYSMRELNVSNGKSWAVNLTGTVRRADAPDTIISTFLNYQNTGTADSNPGTWLPLDETLVLIPAGYRYRIQFYWDLGCQKNTEGSINVDATSCNTSPCGLTASETNTGACYLDWRDSSSSVVTLASYRVYVGSSTTGPWTRIDSGSVSASDYTDSNSYPSPWNETRYYAVTDVDSTGRESPKSPAAVFKTAKFVITRVEAVPTTVTIGQAGVPVKVYIENTGLSPARISEADLFFSDPPVGLYNKSLLTSLPIDLAGGASTTLTFSVDILDGSVPDTDVIDAVATGSSLQVVSPSPRVLQVNGALDTHAWLIRSPANLVVQKITTPATVYRDQKDVEVKLEVINNGNKNAAAYWDSSTLQFSSGLYQNIRLIDTLPIAVYPGVVANARYLVDVNPLSATGTCVVDAYISFRDVNLLTPAVNYDGAQEPGIWTVVAGVMKTFKGPPEFPSYVIESDSFNPKNSAAIFCGVGFRVFGLLNVPKNLKIGFF